MLFLVLILHCWAFLALGQSLHHHDADDKVCSGTQNYLSTSKNTWKPPQIRKRMDGLQKMYQNCTIVNGNLELTYIPEGTNLDFLSEIKEIHGYMLIYAVHTERIDLPNLKVIYGKTQYKIPRHNNSDVLHGTVLVLNNPKLKVLSMPKLQVIHDGSTGTELTNYVRLLSNPYLCHLNQTIRWEEILGLNANKLLRIGSGSFQNCFNETVVCSSSCGDPYCWGPEPSDCQKIYRLNCSSTCDPDSACYSKDPGSCCDHSCLGGCSGPRSNQCFVCKHFDNHGTCVDYCPPLYLPAGPNEAAATRNPKGKYAYLRHCVDECKNNMYIAYENVCVERCPPGYESPEDASESRACKKCGEGGCTSKTCVFNEASINSLNIHLLENCTHVHGNLYIASDAFRNDSLLRPVTKEELNMLSTIRRVTGYVVIHLPAAMNTEYPTWLTSAEFLRGLEVIDVEDGEVCDVTCNSTTGCWGPGPDSCWACAAWSFEGQCLNNCSRELGLFESAPGTCQRCHPLCSQCFGHTEQECSECKYAMYEKECVQECPRNTFFEPSTKNCIPCSPNCDFSYTSDDKICSGPKSIANSTEGGCARCNYAVKESTGSSTYYKCLPQLGQACSSHPDYVDFYPRYDIIDIAKHFVCEKCHPECDKCTSCGNHKESDSCQCKHYLDEETHRCVASCSNVTQYVKVEPSSDAPGVCAPCHSQCEGCWGSLSSTCVKCKHATVVTKLANQDVKNCTERCPKHLPVLDENKNCVAEDNRQKTVYIAIAVIFSVLLIIVACVAYKYRRDKGKLEEFQQSVEPDQVEFHPNPNAKPNLSRLYLISEDELKIGGNLGSGAFGTVYKGFWLPRNGKGVKVVVAIKVLHESNPAAHQEILDEARHMASLNNHFLVRLVGICTGSQMMLVTRLMPLGNLLDYCQKNKHCIGSASLLTWCHQIACGMCYLEENHVVHRDLAARNVLVRKPHHVVISDFGLAKMLEYGQEEYKSAGGKVPVKWLALESIQHRIFTHKSDVWSYGVTLWELLTFGEKPYDGIGMQQIPGLLEKGERLPQPNICTLDLYAILIKCWMVDANSRPSFRELRDQFQKMCRDPPRYLVIEGDKLMRLPSYSCRDERFLLEEIVGEELSQEGDTSPQRSYLNVLEMDEYLQSCPAGYLPPTSLKKLLHGGHGKEPVVAQYCSFHRPSPPERPFKLCPSDLLQLTGTEEQMRALVPDMDTENYLIPNSTANNSYLPLTHQYSSCSSQGSSDVFYDDHMDPPESPPGQDATSSNCIALDNCEYFQNPSVDLAGAPNSDNQVDSENEETAM